MEMFLSRSVTELFCFSEKSQSKWQLIILSALVKGLYQGGFTISSQTLNRILSLACILGLLVEMLRHSDRFHFMFHSFTTAATHLFVYPNPHFCNVNFKQNF